MADVTRAIVDSWLTDTEPVVPAEETPLVHHGQVFGTADGNLTFDQFGELTTNMWNSSHTTPMYRAGSADHDETSYPSITWRCGGDKLGERTPLKHKSIEIYRDEDGEKRQVVIGQYVNNFVVEVKSHDGLQASQLAYEFKKFMLEFTGVLKKMGISEIIYDRRFADDFEERAGRSITICRLQYIVIDEMITHIQHKTIEQVHIAFDAITEGVRT